MSVHATHLCEIGVKRTRMIFRTVSLFGKSEFAQRKRILIFGNHTYLSSCFFFLLICANFSSICFQNNVLSSKPLKWEPLIWNSNNARMLAGIICSQWQRWWLKYLKIKWIQKELNSNYFIRGTWICWNSSHEYVRVLEWKQRYLAVQ